MKPTPRTTAARGCLAILAILLGVCVNAFAATYYVDSIHGSDTNPGTDINRPWGTLQRVNQTVFQPGDCILFKAGSRFTGQLRPQGSGKSISQKMVPICIDMYGSGPMPRIDGEGKHLDTLLLKNVEGWEIRNLEITNTGPERVAWRTGVRVCADGQTLHHIRLEKLYIHDVNGDLRKSHEGCGLFFEAKGKEGRFDGLWIEQCRVSRTDRNGICQRKMASGARSVNVIIRQNLLEDIGGDGIKLWGTDGGLIEGNVIRGARTRCNDGAAGIWPFDSDNTVVQYNEVSGVKGIKDGQGFDSDYACRNSLFQYNYSHDNEGGFMLLCAVGKNHCEGTVVRYNISQNDGIDTARIFQIGGNVTGARIYNNTVYVGPKQNVPMVLSGEWDGGKPSDIRFFNNIFWVDGKVRYVWKAGKDIAFESNAFIGTHEGRPADPRAITARPALRRPGGAENGWKSLDAYRLHASPVPMLGLPIPPGTPWDFFGRPLPTSHPPYIGAAEPD